MLTIATWGALELQLDPFTYAMTHQVRVIGSIWVDVGVRLPAAFAVTDPIP